MKLAKLFRRKHAADERSSLFTIHTALIVGVMLVAHLLALAAMGRLPWCTCGLGLVTVSAWSDATSQNFVDPYTFSHILHGLIFYWALTAFSKKLPLRYRLLIAVLIEIGWELLENTPFIINKYRAGTASLNYTGDTILNSLGDVVAVVAGFAMASKLPWKASLGIFLFLELAMLITIRDNLTLNVLMLLYPIDAIREWQVQAALFAS